MLGKLNYRDRPMGIACDPERVGPAFRVIRCSTRIAHRMPQCFKWLPLNIDKKDREFIVAVHRTSHPSFTVNGRVVREPFPVSSITICSSSASTTSVNMSHP